MNKIETVFDSGTRIEHNFDCSFFQSMSPSIKESDRRVFQSPIESAIHVHHIRTVESISGQIFECDLYICLDIHGRFRDDDKYRCGQQISSTQ